LKNLFAKTLKSLSLTLTLLSTTAFAQEKLYVYNWTDYVPSSLVAEFTKETLIRAADEVYFIPEGTALKTQLANFRNKKERIGLVGDEYGDIKGLVTLEDILEEIVGDFTTSNTPTIDEEVMTQSDGSMIIEGSANLRDLNKMFHWNLDTEDARTFNGLILEHLEEILEKYFLFSSSDVVFKTSIRCITSCIPDTTAKPPSSVFLNLIATSLMLFE